MKKEAVFHLNTEEFVYPVSRKQLVFRLRTAKKEIRKCTLVYWDRTDRKKEKRNTLLCCYRDDLFDYFQGEVIFSKIARYQQYYFILEEQSGEKWYYSARELSKHPPDDGFFEYLYVNRTDVIALPEWAKGIVYYQIFPDRFCNGEKENDPAGCMPWGTKPSRENYMGGDLNGIIQKIPYLQELGVECLYLNPIFEGDFNHKYATTDYFQVDPIFGTNDTFKRLVEECHKVNIRIILDGVFNHTGVHFKQFRDVLEKQEKSEYAEWFYINRYPLQITHKDYECVGAYKWMPKLNTANPTVRTFIIGVMDYWIREYHIDGWRLDVADEVDPSVWEEARRVIKERYPDIILLGETWGYGGKMLRGNQLDGVMNYLFRNSVRDYYGKEVITALEFDNQINRMLAAYKEETNLVMYNLLDSHDTERFLYFCKGDKKRLKLATAFQMMFPGSPAIYYGDEVGLTGENDPDCRRCMIWDNTADEELRLWYKKLIAVRKEHTCIKSGKYRTLIADERTNTFAFARFQGKDSCYVILQKENSKEAVRCPVLENGVYVDLLSGKEYISEKADNENFYNGDITEYKAMVQIEPEPYSVKVISKKQGGCKK